MQIGLRILIVSFFFLMWKVHVQLIFVEFNRCNQNIFLNHHMNFSESFEYKWHNHVKGKRPILLYNLFILFFAFFFQFSNSFCFNVENLICWWKKKKCLLIFLEILNKLIIWWIYVSAYNRAHKFTTWKCSNSNSYYPYR